MMRVTILDTTLRDGAQAEGISFSLRDKLEISSLLDELGVDYIEAGQPSNPKDMELFARNPSLRRAKLAAFGSTVRKELSPADDQAFQALLATAAPVIVIFGKASLLHVNHVLRCSPAENLRIIEESCRFAKNSGREVIFDAEHFFDGAGEDMEYAFCCLGAAARGGADILTLCDTNGGTFTHELEKLAAEAVGKYNLPIGIHSHNDMELAAANSIAAVHAGARHVQGTLCGNGERCGNANLATVIAALKGKLGYELNAELSELTRTARGIADISNISLPPSQPFVGQSAFAHKAGMHIDAVLKNPATFEHIPPELVGNQRRTLTSELSGRTQLLNRVKHMFPGLSKASPELAELTDILKAREMAGYAYEAAEASFELLARRLLGLHNPFFKLIFFKTFSEQEGANTLKASALVKIRVDGEERLACGEGDGPVHALDSALRDALSPFYEEVRDMRLIDYKVRVLNPQEATAAQVRVLIASSDGTGIWSTVGVSTDIIHASWQALSDSVEFKLARAR